MKMETKKEKEEAKVKITAAKVFRDKFDKSVLYHPGQELEFEPERAEDVVSRGLAEYPEPLG